MSPANETTTAEERRATDQDAATEQAFIEGTLPEVDRRQSAPPRETIVIAHGPNEHGHDHMASTAQNPELAEERAKKAAAVVDEAVDYPPTGEEE